MLYVWWSYLIVQWLLHFVDIGSRECYGGMLCACWDHFRNNHTLSMPAVGNATSTCSTLCRYWELKICYVDMLYPCSSLWDTTTFSQYWLSGMLRRHAICLVVTFHGSMTSQHWQSGMLRRYAICLVVIFYGSMTSQFWQSGMLRRYALHFVDVGSWECYVGMLHPWFFGRQSHFVDIGNREYYVGMLYVWWSHFEVQRLLHFVDTGSREC